MAGELPESLKKVMAARAELKRRNEEEARLKPIRDFREKSRKAIWDAIHEIRCKQFDRFNALYDRHAYSPQLTAHSGHHGVAWELLLHVAWKEKAEYFLQQKIPDQFQAFDPSLFPCPNALGKVLELPLPQKYDLHGKLKPDFKGGLMGYGITGRGKTRAMMERLKKLVREHHQLQFKIVSAPLLKRQLADAARAGKAHQIIDELLAQRHDDGEAIEDVLFIDDLSQARFTASFAENLFELINRIYSEQRLLIVTVQTTGAELVRKWCADDPDLKDTAQAIVRRLKEYCVQVEFTDETKSRRVATEPAGQAA